MHCRRAQRYIYLQDIVYEVPVVLLSNIIL